MKNAIQKPVFDKFVANKYGKAEHYQQRYGTGQIQLEPYPDNKNPW